jgi:CRP-like cAMP-binding protein
MNSLEIILPILKKIPLFSELNAEQHEAIINNIQLQYYPKDYDLFKQGEEGSAMYIVKNGAVQIYRQDPINGLSENLSEIRNDNFFGEMALIPNKPRNASAKTLEDTELFVLKKTDFLKLLSTTPGMAAIISKQFIERLKSNEK